MGRTKDLHMREAPDLPPGDTAAQKGTRAGSEERTPSSQDAWDIEQENNVIPLTRAEAEKLFGPNVSRPSRVTPLRVVAAQIAASLLVALIVWLFFGHSQHAALSALLGGAVCWIPGGLFAIYLKRAGMRSRMALVAGEAIKAGLTLLLFIAIGEVYPEARWVPMLVAYLAALKTYWVALVL
jgi:ATP synthase protein I